MPPKKIVTLGSLSKEGEDRYSSSGEDVDDQQYFVGGGKNSGLVVQGSPSPTRDRRVTQLIDKIKEKAAQ